MSFPVRILFWEAVCFLSPLAFANYFFFFLVFLRDLGISALTLSSSFAMKVRKTSIFLWRQPGLHFFWFWLDTRACFLGLLWKKVLDSDSSTLKYKEQCLHTPVIFGGTSFRQSSFILLVFWTFNLLFWNEFLFS